MLRELKNVIRKLLRKRGPAEPPRDPYAEVTAPKRPRRPQQSGAVALAEPDEN
jgi:hypothetical protein